ncbi:MAG: endonuclease III [Anaerolineaceae bacterium]|nr:endonuclease III [Anaerolineaceae bacterium]
MNPARYNRGMSVNMPAREFERRRAKVAPLVAMLGDRHGHPVWRAGVDPVDELVNCVLSQSTNDTNRDRAFNALKARWPDWAGVVQAPTEEVIATIRVAGLGNQKGPRIQALLRDIHDQQGAFNIDFLAQLPLEEARAWLTSLHGVGPKTAAIVLCFAFGRPSLPVDTHVHRVGRRLGLIPEKMSAERAHPLMEALVPPDQHYSFHIQLILHGREICHARRPDCANCPVSGFCDWYGARQATGSPG